MKRKKRVWIIIPILFVVCVIPLGAQELDAPNIRVILLVQSEEEKDGSPLNSVITDSISLEFVINDFDVLIIEKGDRETLLSIAERSRTSYLLKALYGIEDGKLAIQLECYRVADQLLFYTGTIRSAINLNLDVTIRDSIGKLITRIQADIQANPDLITYLILDEPPPEEEEDEPGDFQLSGLFAPFIPLGETGDYFQLGFVPMLQGHYRKILPFGTLDIGLFFSMNIIKAEGEENSAQNLLVSLGPDLRLSRSLTERVSLYVKLNGGPSLLMINRNDEGYISLLIPRAGAGGGSMFRLSDSYGLLFELDTVLYFEKSLTITGLLPFLGVYLNL